MKKKHPLAGSAPDFPRRHFIQGLALGGAVFSLGLWDPEARSDGLSNGGYPILRGTTFNLEIAERTVNLTGHPARAMAINGRIPGPVLRWQEGDYITLNVHNRLPVSTSIHWHGIILPSPMDGVPGLSYPGIAPGATFRYHFQVRQSGTFWYHSHTGFQEQAGLYGPIVIEPRSKDPVAADRDYVLVLSDWTDTDPDTVYANLKKMGEYYSRTEPTIPELVETAHNEGFARAWRERMMWDRMRMSPRDLSDVTGYTYTYLVNGVPPAGNWTGQFHRGERVRLRFVNASVMTYFDVRIPGLRMTVVAADGQDVEPVSVDEFRIAVAETFDVVVAPSDDRAYTVFAQAIDRSGYARATLAPQQGMQDAVPPMDPVPTLTMADMGMAMNGMENMTNGHGSHDTGGSGMQMGGMDMKNMPGMNMGNMPGMQAPGQTVPITFHYATEYGPSNTKCIDEASTALDDPGAGLRHNGRKVLTYADLSTTGGALDPREPEREIELHLTGNMERYMWSFNGVPYSDAKPILLHYGERLRIVLVNDTMMNHPIHLHGMWSEIETAAGHFQVRKHTVNVRPAQRISYRVTADAKGRWAYHCHMLYHMNAGMFRVVVVA